MNKKEYIESGILERFVLGQCSEAEIAMVNKAMDDDMDIRDEVRNIEAALIFDAEQQAGHPPKRVRDAVLQQISNQKGKVVTIPENKSNGVATIWRTLAAASVVLFISSLAVNYLQWKNNRELGIELASLKISNTTLAEDLEVSKASYEKSNQIFAFLNDSSTKAIPLNGLPTSPNSKVTIYWNQNSHDVYCAVNALGDPGDQYDYQLWAIVGGTPVSAGIVQVSDTTSLPQKMQSFESAAAFAITIEKKGGSPTPTLEKMVVIGNV